MSDSKMYDPSFPSVCIPRTFSNITDRQVKTVFEQVFGLNTIERVDMVSRKGADGKEFQRVFVHFKKWPAHEEAQRIRRKLIGDNEIKLVYNEPWYWKCRASTSTKPSHPQKKKFTPYIHLSDSDNEQEQEHEHEQEHEQEQEQDNKAPTFPPPPSSATKKQTLARSYTSSIANGGDC